MNIGKHWPWLVIALLALGVISLALVNRETGKQPNTEQIVIGAALGLTGDAATWGEASLNGAQLAVDEINANGGVKGKRIALAVEDSKSDSKGAVLAVAKLRDVNKAQAIIGSWLDIYQGYENNVPEGSLIISPDAGIEAVNKPNLHPRVFSTWYRTQPKSDLAVQHMADHGRKKLYLLVQNDPYYVTVSEFMEQAAKANGVEIVGKDLLTPESDMKAILPKIARSRADTVFFAFYDERLNTEFLKRQKEILGAEIAVYGDEFVQQNYERTDYNPAWFEGIYFYAPRKPDEGFYNAYVSRYQKEPVFGASTTYDAVHMIAQALADQPKDMDQYMRSTSFKTVSYGQVSFDEIGGIKAPENYFTIKQVQDGKAVDSSD